MPVDLVRYAATLLRQPGSRHCIRESGAITLDIEDQKTEHAVAQATLKNQQTIITNQKKILRNQDRLKLVIRNQEKIVRNQQAIIKNQKKILTNQARILARAKILSV